jgi:hypothetical protein
MFTEVSIVVDKEKEGTPEGAPCGGDDCALEFPESAQSAQNSGG